MGLAPAMMKECRPLVPHKGPRQRPDRHAQVPRATWVTYPEVGSLRIIDSSGQAGEIRLRLLTDLPAERLRAALTVDPEQMAALVRERLVRIELASLSDAATERAVGKGLLRALRRTMGLATELRGLCLDGVRSATRVPARRRLPYA
jgi:hypothetical protein